MFTSVNPYTQQIIGEYPGIGAADLETILLNAQKAQRDWAQQSFAKRGDAFGRLGAYLRQHKTQLAALLTAEMGKISAEAEAEIEKCAVQCLYYAQHAEALLQPVLTPTEARLSRVSHEPVGVVLAVMPWNFPFWQVFRYSVPALMAGNATILKHAPNVFGCATAIAAAFEACLDAPGVFQSLVADVDAVQSLLSDDRVHMVTLTGSERAGSAVAQFAGLHLKKSVLELGGSDALLVLKDADIARAAAAAVQSRMMNAGQVCIAAKRFLVEASVKDEFTERVLRIIQGLKQGDPTLPDTHLGPLARPDLAENLSRQVEQAIHQGAQLLTGGQHDGCNFQPTLLDGVLPDSVVFMEETFGPVATLVSVRDEHEAVRLANQSRYGLSAAIWTQDLDKAERLSRQLEVGSVFVNAVVRSDARLPIGGVKKSGYGRELAEAGIKDFCYAKTFYVA